MVTATYAAPTSKSDGYTFPRKARGAKDVSWPSANVPIRNVAMNENNHTTSGRLDKLSASWDSSLSIDPSEKRRH